ncbi:MAG: trans-aconitate 2-methyltransferase [Comamonas sp.]
MNTWNPDLYRRYEDERTRPAQELLARVPLDAVRCVVDLGCGPGNSTELLVHRYAQARVVGIDNDAAMISSARQRLPGVEFLQADMAEVRQWTQALGVAPDLIFANAALQWTGDHETLIPRLFDALAPGGVLAIQMPDNRDEPTHRLMRETAALQPWAPFMGDTRGYRTGILSLGAYYDLLAREAAATDVWHTVYQHPMASAAAIVEWVRATGLKPFLARLPAEHQAGYLAAYEQGLAQAYRVHADGRRLLAFPRLFIVARRTA